MKHVQKFTNESNDWSRESKEIYCNPDQKILIAPIMRFFAAAKVVCVVFYT